MIAISRGRPRASWRRKMSAMFEIDVSEGTSHGVALHEAVDADVALARVGIRGRPRCRAKRRAPRRARDGSRGAMRRERHPYPRARSHARARTARLRGSTGCARRAASPAVKPIGSRPARRAMRARVANRLPNDRPARPPVERPEEGHGETAVPLEALEDRGDLPGRIDRTVDRRRPRRRRRVAQIAVPEARDGCADRRVACFGGHDRDVPGARTIGPYSSGRRSR